MPLVLLGRSAGGDAYQFQPGILLKFRSPLAMGVHGRGHRNGRKSRYEPAPARVAIERTTLSSLCPSKASSLRPRLPRGNPLGAAHEEIRRHTDVEGGTKKSVGEWNRGYLVRRER